MVLLISSGRTIVYRMNRADGTPINAVFGFTNMLVKLIEDYNDDRMIVIFDVKRKF